MKKSRNQKIQKKILVKVEIEKSKVEIEEKKMEGLKVENIQWLKHGI